MADHEEKFKFITEGAAKAAGDFDKVADASEKVETANKKTGMSFADLGGAIVAAKAAYDVLNAVIGDSIALYAEVDAEQGRIIRNLEQMGVDAEEASGYIEGLNKKLRANIKFGLGIVDQTRAYRKLLDATKDRAEAESDLALAIDIQADGITDLAGATEALKKARLGDAGVLKELGVLTKNQEQQLSGIKDEAVRTRVAMELLNREFTGAAERNLGLADKLASTEEQINAVKIATGKLVTQLGSEASGLINKLILTEDQLNSGETALGLFAKAMTNLSNQTSVAKDNLGFFLDEFTTEDWLRLKAAGGILSGEGVAIVRGVAARGRARDQQDMGASRWMAAARKRGKAAQAKEDGAFVGPQLSTDELIARAVAEDGGAKTPSKSAPEAWKASADQIEMHASNHYEAMVALQYKQEEELARIIEEGRAERAANDLTAYQAETQQIKDAAAEKIKAEKEKTAADKEATDEATAMGQMRNQQRVDDIALGADFVATGAEVAAGFIQNEKAKLAFEAIAASARAAVSFALAFTPPPVGGPQYLPGAIAQSAAAVAMAAKAGASVSSGASGKGGGGGGGGAAPSAPSPEDSSRLSAFGQGSGGVFERQDLRQINIYSTFGPSPEDTRRLHATIREEERRQS